VVAYYDNGKIESIVHLRDQVRDGDAKFFGRMEILKKSLLYANGVLKVWCGDIVKRVY